MMTHRERVMAALNFKPTDRIPRDLGGMLSTGISCFAYPHLVKTLGLPPRLPRVYDPFQMLALPDRDVLDALDCDVVTVLGDDITNAFDEPEKWKPYDFNGRLPARVRNPDAFSVQPDGTIIQGGGASMPPTSFVFDAPHGGEPLDLDAEPPREDLDALRRQFESGLYTPERVQSIARYVRRARAATDRAIMFGGVSANLGFRGGIAQWSMHCLLNPDYVHAVQAMASEYAVRQAERLIPAIKDDVDIFWIAADDQGTQNSTILSPAAFAEFYTPYYRTINDAIHALAPNAKTFLHSCGAIYEILDAIIDSHFDILNPVQWQAGTQGYRAWKDKCRGRIALWGGGVNSQGTLPLGTVEEVYNEARTVASCLKQDSGFVFCCVHNLLAEIPGEKVVALYRAAADASRA